MKTIIDSIVNWIWNLILLLSLCYSLDHKLEAVAIFILIAITAVTLLKLVQLQIDREKNKKN